MQVVNIYIMFKAMKLDEISKGGVHIVKKSRDPLEVRERARSQGERLRRYGQ